MLQLHKTKDFPKDTSNSYWRRHKLLDARSCPVSFQMRKEMLFFLFFLLMLLLVGGNIKTATSSQVVAKAWNGYENLWLKTGSAMKRSDKSFVSGSEMSKVFLSPLQTPTFQFACTTINVWQSAVWCSLFLKLSRVSETSSLQTPKPLYHKVNVPTITAARFHPLSLKQSN